MDWKSYLAALGSRLTSSHKPKPLPERRGNHQSLNEDIVLLIISLLPVVCEAIERKRALPRWLRVKEYVPALMRLLFCLALHKLLCQQEMSLSIRHEFPGKDYDFPPYPPASTTQCSTPLQPKWHGTMLCLEALLVSSLAWASINLALYI